MTIRGIAERAQSRKVTILEFSGTPFVVPANRKTLALLLKSLDHRASGDPVTTHAVGLLPFGATGLRARFFLIEDLISEKRFELLPSGKYIVSFTPLPLRCTRIRTVS